MRAAPFTLWALGLLACGDYVDYEEERPPALTPGGVAPEERLAEVTSLAHLELEGLLATAVHADGEGRQTLVDYQALEAPEARVVLDRYLATLRAVPPEQLEGGPERLAYWINAYNASVLLGVLESWGGNPDYSVSDADFGFFRQRGHRFAGRDLSLDEIEHAIIRADAAHPAYAGADAEAQAAFEKLHREIWDDADVDPRIHAALNCASLSCPNLLPTAYRAAELEAQLDAATRGFCADPDKGAGPDGESALFTWYQGDFEPAYGSPRAFVQAHRDDVSDVDFDRTIDYDWTLNVRR